MTTGFERYLLDNEFKLIDPSGKTNESFNTYTCVGRTYEKKGKLITIGLMGSPTRIGIRFPPPHGTVTALDTGEIVISEILEKHTYLPSEDQYEEWEKALTNQ
jgi:hypothetical protein